MGGKAILDSIDTPAKLKRLDMTELQRLADEIRSFLLESISRTGGHFAPNLGAVELTIALHHVFESPRDRFIWDVGHQSYPHKILTGRKSQMDRIRQIGGISGFPCRTESEHDTFGAGHAGTSISAALGVALGLRKTTPGARVVAVVGDGSLSAGMTFEALNHAGISPGLPLTIVLNDNGMSISPALGGLHEHLQALTRSLRTGADDGSANPSLPPLFAALGLDYAGPIDGHDMAAMINALNEAREANRPRVVHVVTRKGRGYAPAETDAVRYHGPGPFDLSKGIAAKTGRPTFSDVFGDWICDAAARDHRVVGITPAMREGSCLVKFEKSFPERYIDVGIAEQHAITLAGGLAVAGMKPVVAIYSTFLQRGYDQVIHDIALQNLPVVFALDRAGIAGGDGATHLGAFDIAALRCIPNMVLMTPSDEHECRQMLETGLALAGPSAVRYPRAAGHSREAALSSSILPIGKGVELRRSKRRRGVKIAILNFGPLLPAALEVAERIDASVADMRFVKPLDEDLLLILASTHDVLVTLEEGVVAGGAGSACAERLAAEDTATRLLRLGLPDTFIEHGDRTALLRQCGLDADGILASIRGFVRISAAAPAVGSAIS